VITRCLTVFGLAALFAVSAATLLAAPAEAAPSGTPAPTTTGLLTLPASPATNEPTTLIATIKSSSAAPPAGSVTFENGIIPVSGCSDVAVATLNQSVNVNCSTAFAASSSPEQLRALFSPSAGSGLTGSISQTLTLVVGQAATSTSLDVSEPTVKEGSTVTYTATVASVSTAPFQPSGFVQFFDQGKAIASCTKQYLALSALSAQCAVRYTKPGRHAITAQYSGDGNFSGSTSSQSAVDVPILVLGTIKSTMRWTFRYTPTVTTVLAMVVKRARTSTKITISCKGKHCPFASRSLVVTKATGCGPGSNSGCFSQSLRTVDLAPSFDGMALPAGSHLTIEFTRPSWIGKTYLFTIRSGHPPRDQILCLAPGSIRPGVGC
jgi:hypothetical protein